MKIIIAPAKTIKTDYHNLSNQVPLFYNKTKKLKKILQQYDEHQIHDVMKVSFKLSSTVYDYYHQAYDASKALYTYQGTVFKELSLNQYDDNHFDYLDKHLIILSSYYGILKYDDGITPYRLDNTMNIGINLYDYWHKDIKKYFKDEDFIISLASKEYLKMVDHPKIINIDFVEDKAGKLTRNATLVKKARGKFLNHLIKNNISDLDKIKDIIIDDYTFNDDLSTNNNYVFLRKAQAKYRKI